MPTPAVTPPADGPALGTPPSTSDTANFDARADAFFAALPAFQTDSNALKANAAANAAASYANALEVATNTAAVAANAALVAAYAGASAWVSGTTYGLGVVAWSPINQKLYRKITATAGGVVDPSNNTTDWAIVSTVSPAVLVTGTLIQGVNGGTYAATNVTAQPAATNRLLYSLQFDNAAWVKASMTVSADFTMSTTGDVNADKLVEAAATAPHTCSQVITAAANVSYTFSVMVKAAGRNSIALSIDRDSTLTDCVEAKFDLTGAGASSIASIGTGSGAAASCLYQGNGFYLCSISGTPSSSAGTTVRAMIHLSDFNTSYAGDGVSGVSVAEAQLETGMTATSRIATGAATATRASGVIYPTRLVLPASPGADWFVSFIVANNIDQNVIDPNGSTIMGLPGPMKVDNNYASAINLQNINGTWRLI